MKFWFGLALLALAIPNAHGEGIEIVSPNHAYTFAYGDAFSHQIERDPLTNQMIARVFVQQLSLRRRLRTAAR